MGRSFTCACAADAHTLTCTLPHTPCSNPHHTFRPHEKQIKLRRTRRNDVEAVRKLSALTQDLKQASKVLKWMRERELLKKTFFDVSTRVVLVWVMGGSSVVCPGGGREQRRSPGCCEGYQDLGTHSLPLLFPFFSCHPRRSARTCPTRPCMRSALLPMLPSASLPPWSQPKSYWIAFLSLCLQRTS